MKNKSLTLVKIKDYYFPAGEKDYQSLVDCGVSVFRIDPTLLNLLKKTSLKGFEVSLVTWVDLLTKLQSSFVKQLVAVGFKNKLEDIYSLVVKFDKLKEPEFDNLLKKYKALLSRYGIKIIHEYKDIPEVKRSASKKAEPASTMVRLRLIESLEIDPALGYGVRNLVDTTQEKFINFSTVARMKMVSSLNESKKPYVSMVFEDKIGDQWVESFRRAFDSSKISRSEINDFASGLIQSLVLSSSVK